MGVDGASEVRTKKDALAFINKYTELLAGLSNSFTLKHDPHAYAKVELSSRHWTISLNMTDMRVYGRPPGYHVRVSMSPSGEIAETLRARRDSENHQYLEARRKRLVDQARGRGELKGLN